jgi:hypothetical protein
MFSRRVIYRAIALHALMAMLMLVFGVRSRAQSTNATVTGLVTDTTGAVVSGATVELLNTATGVPRVVQTNNDGLYRIPGLVPGDYRATISHDGFKSVIKAGIILHVQDEVGLNFSLEVGSVNESVTVQSGEPLLQTESTSLSQVIEPRTVQDMPLNGRNVMNLVTLVPGVVALGETAGNPTQTNSFVNSWGNYQIGGGMANQSSTYIDGAPVNTSYVNSVSLVPTQDSIQEFRIETNNVNTEFGRFAGGVINMSTKSGTNDFHGSVYEYIRNQVLDANDFFSNMNGIARPPFNQNQFGATLSGPIRKNKLFNFFSWEQFHLRTATTAIYTVPTQAERNGDFSQFGEPIYDPLSTSGSAATGYTRQQFMGCNGNQANVICPSRLDPAAVAIVQYFPLPPANLANQPFNNYPSAGPSGSDYNQYVDRVDWAVSNKQHIFGRYTWWGVTITQINPFGTIFGEPPQKNTDNQFVLGDDYQLNQTTTATVRLSYFRFIFGATPLSQGFNLSSLGPAWDSLAGDISSHEVPVPNMTGVTVTQPANFTSVDTHVADASNITALSGNIGKQWGKHNLAFGGEIRYIQWSYSQNNNGSGSFTFDPGFTQENPLATIGSAGGSSVASFMLGTASSGTLDNENNTFATQWYGGPYIDDTYRASTRLTLHAGLRWEQPGAFSERHNAQTVLLPDQPDPLAIPATNLPIPGGGPLTLTGQLARPNTSLYPYSGNQRLHWDLFSPRVGFTLGVTNSTVLRGGYGISYLPNDVAFQAAPFQSPVNLAATAFNSSTDGGLTPYSTLSNPFPLGVAQPIGGDASKLVELEGTSVTSPIPSQPYPYVQQWNLNIQQQFGSKTVLQIGYGASKGTHLPLYELQMNQLPDQYDSLGSQLLVPTTNPFRGVVSPTSTLYSPTQIPTGDLLAPHPQFTGFAAAAPTLGASNYNSLQLTAHRSFGHAGNIVGVYTWSKLMSNTDTLTAWLNSSSPADQYGAQDAYNLHAEHSVSSNNYPNDFVLSYVVDLPFGRGRSYLRDLNPIANGVFGGWTLSGITTYISGQPLSLASENTTLSADFGAGTPRPDVVPNCSKQISGSPSSRINEWFNTACFTQPDSFGFGNAPRNDSAITAAGVANWDIGLAKSFPLWKESRILQFRAEAFNVANHVQMGVPGETLGSGTFGVISSQANFPRIFQFSGRINF